MGTKTLPTVMEWFSQFAPPFLANFPQLLEMESSFSKCAGPYLIIVHPFSSHRKFGVCDQGHFMAFIHFPDKLEERNEVEWTGDLGLGGLYGFLNICRLHFSIEIIDLVSNQVSFSNIFHFPQWDYSESEHFKNQLEWKIIESKRETI